MSSHKVMVLGGTAEAGELAARLASDDRLATVTSLAGLTRLPAHQLPWKAITGEEMTEALNKLGITLRPARRKIEVLVIEPIDKAI